MKFVSRFILKFFGWSFQSDSPPLKKCILIAAPHTRNWDFPLMLIYGFMLDLKYYWLGKHSLFLGPIGPIMRKLGGIPVDRSKKNDYVASLSKEITSKVRCILIIPPEGTRSRSKYWKSGFIYIARQADVPIVFAKLDYRKKNLTFSQNISASVSDDEIMKFAQVFYRDVRPLLFLEVTPANKDILIILLGNLTTLVGLVCSYYFGSSVGSKDKTEEIEGLMKKEPNLKG